jgi:hypothetical protein
LNRAGDNLEDGVLLAVVTTQKEKVYGGGVPIFLAKDKKEMESISLLMSRLFKAMAHDLENGVWVIYRQ